MADLSALLRAHLLLLLGSASLLGGAFAFQHFGGLHPCELCIWQRWAHAVTLVVASLAVFAPTGPRRGLLGLGALSILAGAGIAMFHVGVEQKWWKGLETCSVDDLGSGDFLTGILAAPVVQCDQVAWSLAGISMAGYNAILSAVIGGVALWLILKRS